MSSSLQLFDRGKTWIGATIAAANYGTSNHMEGQEVKFQDEDPSDRTKTLTGMKVHCICVRNDSAVTLYAGEQVTWTTAYVGRRIGAKATDLVPTEGVAGIVDDFLPSGGVLDGDLFWLVRKGPTRAKNQATVVSFTAGGYFGPDVDEGGRAMTIDSAQTDDTGAVTQAITGRVLTSNNVLNALFRVYINIRF